MENLNWRIFFFFSYPRILVLWKTGIGGFFFFFFFYPRILVLWKTRIGEFFFFLAENSPIVENQNLKKIFFFSPRILVL